VKSIITFHSPSADNLFRVEVHCVHNFEQPLLLCAVAGRRVGTGRKFSARAHLYSASTNILVYFSTPVDSLCPLLTFCHKQVIYLLA